MNLVELPVPPLVLGEGPIWDVRDDRLYWIDQQASRIYAAAASGENLQEWKLPVHIGSIALRRAGGLLVAAEDGLSFFDPSSGTREVFADPEAGRPQIFLNDGGVDAAGRFVVGSIDHGTFPIPGSDAGFGPGQGSLYCVTSNDVQQLDTGFRCVNGPCWSPDGRTLYFSDTLSNIVYSTAWNAETASCSERAVFISPEAGIMPDGAAIDEEGGYWCACMGVGQIRRYNPSGELDRTIDLPDPRITSVAFGGADLDQIFVTSMTFPFDMTPVGRLFRVDGAGVRGLPAVGFVD